MKLSSGYNYNIHMVYMDPKTGATIWEHTQPVNPKNIFCNAALTFELPKGPHVPGVKEFEVKLEIVVGTSTYKSQSVPFSYINIRENFLSLRRRHWVDNNETFATKATNGSFLFNAMNPPYGCRLISDSNYINEEFDYALNTYASRDTVIKKTKTLKVPNGESNKEISINKDVEFENTSFHEAIMDCELRYNLLHYACFHNKAIAIKPLVELGCGLQEQDLEGRTPLHLAIEYARKECILEFEHLLENYQQYPKAVVKKLIEMFYVYDNLGHTIVHAAVMARLTTLFEAMLKFCHSHCMNITRCGILGNGDSVIHLIVKRNLIDMAPLLKEYIPTFLTIKNYAGQTALDLDDLSMQMFELLHDEITKKKKN
uniref:Uncharacterized protein n=1 Tax=Stomoxys calcitrans TaxID=35570 RepID=A0A1I8QA08_STOCA